MVFADLNYVAVFEQLFLYLRAVEQRTVGAAAVFKYQIVADLHNRGVFARDGKVVGGPTADGEALLVDLEDGFW